MIVKFIKKHDILFSLIITLLIILIFDLLGWTQNAKVMNWVAFGTGVYIVIFLEIVKGSKLRYKIMSPIGFSFLFCLVLYAELDTRYELQHHFFKPCWSPDGKQIAFFMNKGVYNYRWNMIGGWSPDTIWEKYYLCTMNYDGGNFKQIKQTEQATDEISWSGSGEIVYTQLVKQDINTVLQSKILATSSDGKETGILFETAKIPTRESIKGTERLLDPWLSRDKRYLGFVLNYREPKKTDEEDVRLGRYYDNYELIVKDLKTQQNKIYILQRDVKALKYRKFYGSYNMDKIAYYNNNILEVIDLGNNEIIKIDMIKFKQNGYLPYFSTWDMFGTYLLGMKDKFNIEKRELAEQNNSWYLNTGIVAPNGEMRASTGIVWDKNDKTIGIIQIKSKRSYLFNIFPK